MTTFPSATATALTTASGTPTTASMTGTEMVEDVSKINHQDKRYVCVFISKSYITFLIESIFAFLFMLPKLSTHKAFSTTIRTIMIFLELRLGFTLLCFIIVF